MIQGHGTMLANAHTQMYAHIHIRKHTNFEDSTLRNCTDLAAVLAMTWGKEIRRRQRETEESDVQEQLNYSIFGEQRVITFPTISVKKDALKLRVC